MPPTPEPGSVLLAEELFATGDPRFLDELRRVTDTSGLGAMAKLWQAADTLFARRTLHDYLTEGAGADLPGHRFLVKRLFKAAESAANVGQLGDFLFAFDRLSVRDWRETSGWDERRFLRIRRVPARALPLGARGRVVSGRDPRTARHITIEVPSKADHRLFSARTRRYLKRRAFRFFRKLGRNAPPSYVDAVAEALLLYRDEHVSDPARLFDAWGLMHVIYGRSLVIKRHPDGITLAPGATLAALEPAPIHGAAWALDPVPLLRLVGDGGAVIVRRFGLDQLRKRHGTFLAAPTLAALRPLLSAPSDEAQSLVVELLPRLAGLETLPVADWLACFESARPMAAAALVPLAEKTLHPGRLTAVQCLGLALHSVAPGAELGLRWLRYHTPGMPSAETLAKLTGASVLAVRAAATQWALECLAADPADAALRLRDLVDGRYADVRAAALTAAALPERANELVWSAMAESPYPEVRAALLDGLRQARAIVPADARAELWRTALLGLNSGAAARLRAVDDIAQQLTPETLPLLRIVLKALSGKARRVALTHLTRYAIADPKQAEAVDAAFPGFKRLSIGPTSQTVSP